MKTSVTLSLLQSVRTQVLFVFIFGCISFSDSKIGLCTSLSRALVLTSMFDINVHVILEREPQTVFFMGFLPFQRLQSEYNAGWMWSHGHSRARMRSLLWKWSCATESWARSQPNVTYHLKWLQSLQRWTFDEKSGMFLPVESSCCRFVSSPFCKH